MTKFIHISDPHLSPDYTGQHIMLLTEQTGKTPTEQFAVVMEHINKNHPDTAFFLLSGDVVQDGTVEQYRHFRRYIESFTGGKPCYAIPGNHDSDAFWQGWFGTEPGAVSGDYAVADVAGGLKLIALDSRGGPYGSGVLSGAQSAWLREQVSDGAPCIIMLHHTPHIGEVAYLIYQMQSSREFYDAVRGGNVLGIFAGHTHIHFESMLGVIPCHTVQSMTFGLITDEHTMTATDETGYNCCVFDGGTVTVQNTVLHGSGARATLVFD